MRTPVACLVGLALGGDALGQPPQSSHELWISTMGDPSLRIKEVRGGSDLDGDGWDDIVLMDAAGGGNFGKVRAISGSSGDVMWEALGIQYVEGFGADADFMDVDSDGLPDVLVGAPVYCPPGCSPGNFSGRVAVLKGTTGSAVASIPVTLPPGSLAGLATSFGIRVGAGDDLTGDGVSDFVTCITNWVPSALGFNSGGVAVVSGATGQLGTVIPGTGIAEAPGSDGSIGGGGDVLTIPSAIPGAPGLAVVGSPRTSTATQYFVGSLRVYDGNGQLVLQDVGASQFERLGSLVRDGEDLSGDGFEDFAVLRWPSQVLPPGWGTSPYLPEVDVYAGDSLVLLYTKSISGPPVSPVGQAPVFMTRFDLLPDVDGDGVGDWTASVLWTESSGWEYTRVDTYSGPSGSLLSSWTFVDSSPSGSGTWYAGVGVGDVNGDGWGDVGIHHWPAGGSSGFKGTLDVYLRRNLSVNPSPPVVGSAFAFSVECPDLGGKSFMLLASQTLSPPVMIGPFVIPLAGDALFVASLGMGLIGTLGSAGTGSVPLYVPNDPALQGASCWVSGVVVDAGAPYGIGTVLTRLLVSIG